MEKLPNANPEIGSYDEAFQLVLSFYVGMKDRSRFRRIQEAIVSDRHWQALYRHLLQWGAREHPIVVPMDLPETLERFWSQRAAIRFAHVSQKKPVGIHLHRNGAQVVARAGSVIAVGDILGKTGEITIQYDTITGVLKLPFCTITENENGWHAAAVAAFDGVVERGSRREVQNAWNELQTVYFS